MSMDSRGAIKMKAWSVTDDEECLYATIVFAETRGKAKVISIRALGETSSIGSLFVQAGHVYGVIPLCLARCTTRTQQSLCPEGKGEQKGD